jgi:hypothetical protein
MDERPASMSQLQLLLQEKEQRISQLQVMPPLFPPPANLDTISPCVSQSLVEIAFSGQADKVCTALLLCLPLCPPPPTSLSTLLQHVASAGWIEEVLYTPSV